MHKRAIGPQSDTRDLLLAAGIGQYLATMSLPYMFFLPRTSDPYAQGVMQIVTGLQRLLNKKGAHLDLDGGLGEETIAGIMKYSGPNWYDKSWAQIYGDVLFGKVWKGYGRKDRAPKEPLSDYNLSSPADLGSSFVGDVVASPLPWIAAGAFVWWKWFR